MCKRNRKNRTERRDGQVRTYRPDCMCWVCDTCRPKLQAKWICHGSACLRECGKPIVLVQVALDDFVRFARKLNRMGAKYIRVRANGRYEVFVATNKPERLCGMRVDVSVAVEFYSKLVKKIVSSKLGNPISTCRKWALPSRERSTWELIAEGPTPAQIRKAVEVAECGAAIKCLDRTINGLTVTICSGPILAIDGLCELIASLECESHSSKGKGRYKNTCDDDGYAPESWNGQPDEEHAGYAIQYMT